MCSVLLVRIILLPYLHPVPLPGFNTSNEINYLITLNHIVFNIKKKNIPFPKMASAIMLDEYHVS